MGVTFPCLDEAGYSKDYQAVIYPNASHLLGMMPSREQDKDDSRADGRFI